MPAPVARTQQATVLRLAIGGGAGDGARDWEDVHAIACGRGGFPRKERVTRP